MSSDRHRSIEQNIIYFLNLNTAFITLPHHFGLNESHLPETWECNS